MRDLRGNTRGVLKAGLIVGLIFGSLLLFVILVLTAQQFIFSMVLVVGGFAAILLAPKPYGIWVGLVLVLLGAFVFVTTQSHQLGF